MSLFKFFSSSQTTSWGSEAVSGAHARISSVTLESVWKRYKIREMKEKQTEKALLLRLCGKIEKRFGRNLSRMTYRYTRIASIMPNEIMANMHSAHFRRHFLFRDENFIRLPVVNLIKLFTRVSMYHQLQYSILTARILPNLAIYV